MNAIEVIIIIIVLYVLVYNDCSIRVYCLLTAIFHYCYVAIKYVYVHNSYYAIMLNAFMIGDPLCSKLY